MIFNYFLNLNFILSIYEPFMDLQPTIYIPIFDSNGELIINDSVSEIMNIDMMKNISLYFSINLNYDDKFNSIKNIQNTYKLEEIEVILQYIGIKKKNVVHYYNNEYIKSINISSKDSINGIYYNSIKSLSAKYKDGKRKGCLYFYISSDLINGIKTIEERKEVIKNLKDFIGFQDINETDKYILRFSIIPKLKENTVNKVIIKTIYSNLFTLNFNIYFSSVVLNEYSDEEKVKV